jgi:hypothetical protein
MNRVLIVRIACLSVAVLLLLLAAWSLLWVISSSSMAFSECAGSYSLWAENPRCRQPPLAGLLCLGSLGVAVGLYVFAARYRK